MEIVVLFFESVEEELLIVAVDLAGSISTSG